jgi:hypothetical protein
MLLSKTKIRNYAFIAGFCTLLLYNFHRYIFKYNSEGTSPTYTNTPLIWKVGKYLILSMIMACFLSCVNYASRVNKWFVFTYLVVLIILLVNFLNFFIYGVFDAEETEYCFWFLLLTAYWFTEDSVFNININYNKLLTNTALVLFISNGIVIANYYATGRLPALAYEGGLVRFGGFWDDPNAFGIVCVFYFFYFINRQKYILSCIALVNIVLTFSFTSYFLLLISIGYWIFTAYNIYNKKWILFGIFICSLIAMVIVHYFDLIKDLYDVKAESVNEHLTKQLVFNIWPLQNSPLQFSENWYESSFYNYFPVSVLIHLAFLLLSLSLFKNSKDKELKFYFFLFIVGSFFFSMLYIFPLNFIFIFLLIDYLKRNSAKTIYAKLS